ncbi:MAG: hypothetical protein HW421_2481 [Ignavibacteria bacterium]|nr:hypothetical protein [Ignavibacteria bacterium]
MTLDQILDEAEALPNEELLMFNEILSNRVREKKRKELIETVEQSRKEYNEGKARETTVQDVMNEIMS